MTQQDQTLFVSESFGPTLQGEGPSCGQPAIFLRLGGCNLKCSWCDTKYTWSFGAENSKKFGTNYNPKAEIAPMHWRTVYDNLISLGAENKLVVVTGGEPMLQQPALVNLLQELDDSEIEIETNGTIAPLPNLSQWIDHYNVSPKLANSDNPLKARRHLTALRRLDETCKARFKFVVNDLKDFDEIDRLVKHIGCYMSDVWIMPEGTTAPVVVARLPHLAEAAIQRGYNVTTRLHVLLWGNERGH